MPVDQDDNQTVPQPQEMSIVNEFIGLLAHGADEDGEVHVFKTQGDGTLRAYSLTVGQRSDGTPLLIKLEDTGEQRVVMIGEDQSGDLERFGLEDTRELRVSNFMRDSGAVLRSPLVNSRFEQVIDWTRSTLLGEPIAIDPTLLPAAPTVVVGPVPAGELYRVDIEVVSVTGVATDLDIFVDPSGEVMLSSTPA